VLIPKLAENTEYDTYTTLRAPERSQCHWDYGKDPVELKMVPELSIAEKLAIQRQVVIGNVYKVHKAFGSTTYMQQFKLKEHLIALPTDAPEVISSFVDDVLPRTDIAKHYRLLFIGKKNQENLAYLLNKKNLSFDFEKVKKWLEFLQLVNPLYENYTIASTGAEVNWDAQKDEIFESNVIFADEDVALHIEQKTQSDIAEGWEASNETKPSENTVPLVQSVMLTQHTGYTDLQDIVLNVVDKKLGIKKEDADDDDGFVRFHFGASATNEFFYNHNLIAGAFPHLFPLGITFKD